MLYWMKQQESIIKISSEKNWTMMLTKSAMKSGRTKCIMNWGDERQNLNKDVNGVIIAFGDLGLWNGRKQGYQILGDNIAGILQSTQYDAEWYGDGYDIRGRMSHHDGTNLCFCTVSLKIVTTQNRLPQKSTTMKLTRMVFAKLHVPSTPMWQQCMAGKLYRTTSFR